MNYILRYNTYHRALFFIKYCGRLNREESVNEKNIIHIRRE